MDILGYSVSSNYHQNLSKSLGINCIQNMGLFQKNSFQNLELLLPKFWTFYKISLFVSFIAKYSGCFFQ